MLPLTVWEPYYSTEWRTTPKSQLHLPQSHCLLPKKYSQLDKEALAIVFGIKKFHQYVYGRRFVIQTDHKPLERVFNPDKMTPPIAAAKIQRTTTQFGSKKEH